MNQEQLLQDIVSLPIMAQRELINFIDFLKLRYGEVSKPLTPMTATIAQPGSRFLSQPGILGNSNNVWDEEEVSIYDTAISEVEIEAVCGLYQADCTVSLEQMEEAIVQGALNGRY